MYPLFFASGAAGLIYEIVWTRMLVYVFGSGLYAVTAVISAFMAGLALGSYMLGRSSDGVRFPLRFYAMIEMVIAVAGFLLPMALHQTDRVDSWAYARWDGNFAILTLCRFAVTFAVLMIPTTLMGATLPVLSRAFAPGGSRLGLRVGELYAVNTAGAVAGAFLAGFYLIGKFGVMQTNFVAAILNSIAAAGTYIISGLAEKFPGEEKSAPPASSAAVRETGSPCIPENSTIHAVLFASFATGLVSMGAQVIWSRALVFAFEYLKNTTYAFSAMLTIFLTGLALGSALAGLFADRLDRPMRFYGLIIALIGLSIALSVNVLHWGAGETLLPNPFDPVTKEFSWGRAAANIMAQSAFILAIPTLLMGMAFPISVRAALGANAGGGVGREVGKLYALNTAGSILGPILACFIIIPLAGLSVGLLLLSAAEIALGLFLYMRGADSKSSTGALAVLCAAGFVLSAFGVPWGRGMQALNPGEQTVYYDEGPMATVSVVKNTFGYNTIYIDGVGVAGTDPMLQTDQKSLAHLPMLLVGNPRAALTVGFGSGGASYSYLLHNRLEKVHCAEICPAVPRAAPNLTDANHGFLEQKDPRYKIIFDDVRSYLRHTEQMYDIIATDCTDLRYKSNANLYDVEYFRFCRARLNSGGVVVVWMPLAGLSLDMFKLALRTFHLVFPEMAVFFMDNEPTHYILLVGWRDKMEINYRRMAERLAEPDVKADLAELNLDDPVKILSTWITGGDALDAYLAGETYNTENFPYLEFESPKYGYADRPILDNLASLIAIRNSPRDFMPRDGIPPAELERLERYERAMPLIVEGHAHYRNIDIEQAARNYIEAQKLAPEDASVGNLLGFRELVLGTKLGNPWSWLMLGRAQDLQGRDDDAADDYARVEQMLAALPLRTPIQETWLKNAKTWREELLSRKRK